MLNDMLRRPTLDPDKCNLCGLCVSVCLHGGLVIIEGTIQLVETDDCEWCTNCEAVCPNGAISCPFDIIIEEATE